MGNPIIDRLCDLEAETWERTHKAFDCVTVSQDIDMEIFVLGVGLGDSIRYFKGVNVYRDVSLARGTAKLWHKDECIGVGTVNG